MIENAPNTGQGEPMLENLSHFTGTETWYRTIIPGITYTEGAKYVADECSAYWLLDDIAIYQNPVEKPHIYKEEFQVWKLRTNLEKSSAVLTVEDGNGKVVDKFKIPFTTFPVERMELWYTNRVIFLPSEY